MCNCLSAIITNCETLNLCGEDLCGDCAYKNVTTKCQEFVIRNSQGARDSQECHALRAAFKMAGAISKQGGQGSNLFPRRNRAFTCEVLARPSARTVRSSEGRSSRCGPGCRAFAPRVEASSKSRECHGIWSVFTTIFCLCIEHDSSLGVIQRANSRARARAA